VSLAEEVAWSRRLFDSLAEHGTWGVPRSGLVFQRQGTKLVLVEKMPHMPEMSIDAAVLAKQQLIEYTGIKKRFELAGVPVEDATLRKAD
jgi:hypothetical protein